VVDRVVDVVVARQRVGVEGRLDHLHEADRRGAGGGVGVPAVLGARVAGGLVHRGLVDRVVRHRVAVRAQDRDGLVDPPVQVVRVGGGRARGRAAARGRGGGGAGAGRGLLRARRRGAGGRRRGGLVARGRGRGAGRHEDGPADLDEVLV